MLIGSVVSSTDAASNLLHTPFKNMGLKYGTASMLRSWKAETATYPAPICFPAVMLIRHKAAFHQRRLHLLYDVAQLFFGILSDTS